MTLVVKGLILALLAQGVLALVLLCVLGRRRLPLVARGKVRIADIALSRAPWPETAQKASNAFDNQFQLPILFYLAGLLALYLTPTWLELVLAWLFVLTRIVHAFIFVTTNRVAHRFTAYVAGFAVLVVFWIDLAVRVILA